MYWGPPRLQEHCASGRADKFLKYSERVSVRFAELNAGTHTLSNLNHEQQLTLPIPEQMGVTVNMPHASQLTLLADQFKSHNMKHSIGLNVDVNPPR